MAFRDRVRVFWGEICTKWYETELESKTRQEAEAFRATKVRCYLAICAWGIGSMFFGKGVSSMEIVNKAHPVIAYACVLFFVLSFLGMAVGAAAAFFPRCTPFHPIGLTGFGAWISVVRAIACYQLDTYEFHPKPQATCAIASFVITSAAVSVYWACTAQDPRFLHVKVKLLGCLFRGIWFMLVALVGILRGIAVPWMRDQRTQLKASVRAWAGYQPLPANP